MPPAASDRGSEFFISPVLRFDSRSLTVLFQVRDSRSGDVVRQFPPEVVVERYRQDPTSKPFVVASPAPDDRAPEPVEDDRGADQSPPVGTSGAPEPGAPSAEEPAAGPVDLVA